MPMKPELERRLASLDTASAAEALVRGHGPEILGFLVALLRDDDAADEAFAVFSEDVWRGLPSFKREASYRTWAYLLARQAALRVFNTLARQAAGEIVARAMTGHTTTEMTEHYSYVSLEEKAKAVSDALGVLTLDASATGGVGVNPSGVTGKLLNPSTLDA